MEEVFRAKMNSDGRLMIPTPCRRRVGLQPGQEVMLKVTHDGLLITTFDQALERFQDEVKSLVGPTASIVDEMIAERRIEGAKEAGE